MITAVDTNVLYDILRPNLEFAQRSEEAIEKAGAAGVLVVCEVVYAELGGIFGAAEECDRFLEDNRIGVEPLGRRACFLAGQLWSAYRGRGGKRERILPDFLIGAHAQTQASRLLTRDRGFYREMFPELAVVEPGA